jgi:hypothetical protein
MNKNNADHAPLKNRKKNPFQKLFKTRPPSLLRRPTNDWLNHLKLLHLITTDNSFKNQFPKYQSESRPELRKPSVFLPMTGQSRHRPKQNMWNVSNLIRVRRSNPVETNNVTKTMLPKLALINACSLLPKFDELIANLSVKHSKFVAVTETWLNDDIEDNLVSIRGYNIFRRDRPYRCGGGVCVYLFEHIYAKWLWLHPTCLPRPLSGITVCVVDHPPGFPKHEHITS